MGSMRDLGSDKKIGSTQESKLKTQEDLMSSELHTYIEFQKMENLLIDENNLEDFNNQGTIQINFLDLPLCCPLPDQQVWNAHPRVYLPIHKTGKATCPYCSAQYVLKR